MVDDGLGVVLAGHQVDDPPSDRDRVIGEALAQAVLDGRLRADAKLPPLRVLADALSVTVGTVGRAYAEIERQGLVTSRVGDGTYVLPPGERTHKNEFDNAPDGMSERAKATLARAEAMTPDDYRGHLLARDQAQLVHAAIAPLADAAITLACVMPLKL